MSADRVVILNRRNERAFSRQFISSFVRIKSNRFCSKVSVTVFSSFIVVAFVYQYVLSLPREFFLLNCFIVRGDVGPTRLWRNPNSNKTRRPQQRHRRRGQRIGPRRKCQITIKALKNNIRISSNDILPVLSLFWSG